MSSISYSFNREMRELFDYPDPSMPIVVWWGDFHHLLNHCLACHWHNEFEYCVVTDGTVGFVIDGHYIEVTQGNAVFVNSGVMHSATQVGDVTAKIFTVSFLPAVLSASEHSTVFRKYFLPMLKSAARGFLIDHNKEYAAEIIHLLNVISDLYSKQTGDFELMLISYISQIWSTTISYLDEYKDSVSISIANHQNEEIVKSILNYIHNHYAENIRIEDMARYASTSRSGCFRSFRNYTNKSPMEYLLEYRMTQAIALIAQGNKSITQIATECGFSNSSYFGKLFRKKYGMSPLDYKRQL